MYVLSDLEIKCIFVRSEHILLSTRNEARMIINRDFIFELRIQIKSRNLIKRQEKVQTPRKDSHQLH
jgi:hypothetical protein